MKINHVAIWVQDLEKVRSFFERYFHAEAGEKYVNHTKQFQSYFLSFHEGCTLELMTIPHLSAKAGKNLLGLAHLAISTGSKEKVDELTETLRQDAVTIVGEPRWTGDGYYESVVLDPEGNQVEITI